MREMMPGLCRASRRVTRLLVMRNNLTVYVPARWKILLEQNSRNNLCHVLVLAEDA